MVVHWALDRPRIHWGGAKPYRAYGQSLYRYAVGSNVHSL